MAMRGERVERHVAQHAEIGQSLFQRADGAADQVVRVERLLALGVLQRRIDRRKHRDGRNAELGGLARGVDQCRDRQPPGAGHRVDRGAAVFVMHEDRPDQIAGGKKVLGDQLARPRIAAVAPEPRGRIGRQRREEGLAHGITPARKAASAADGGKIRWRAGRYNAIRRCPYSRPCPTPACAISSLASKRAGGWCG